MQTSSTIIQKDRREEKYVIYIKRHPMVNNPSLPPITVDKETFFTKGSKVSVYITKITKNYLDDYTYTLTLNDDNQLIESYSDKPVNSIEQIIYADSRIPTDKADWDRLELDDFDRCIKYFKSEFDTNPFSNKVSLDLVLDQSISDTIIDSEIIEWIFAKFTNKVNLLSINTQTNMILFPNAQYNNNSIEINGFDIIATQLVYIKSNSNAIIKNVRIIHKTEEANSVSDLTIETRVSSFTNVELHGMVKLNVIGILDSEENFMYNRIDINSIIFKLKEQAKSKFKRNLVKIMNFRYANINSIIIPKEYDNSCFFHIIGCTELNISNYSNSHLSKKKKGSEILIEDIAVTNINDCTLNAEMEDNDYYFISASKMEDAANVSFIDCNFLNVGAIEVTNESYGKILFSSCNIVGKSIIKSHNYPIVAIDFDSCTLKGESLDIKTVSKLSFTSTNMEMSKDINFNIEKIVVDNCNFTIGGNVTIKLEADAELSNKKSIFTETGIQCKDFKISSEEQFNRNLSYAQFKLYCNNYEDLDIDKVLINDKTIIEAYKYSFNSFKMNSTTEEFFLRLKKLFTDKKAINIKSVFSGIMTFDVEEASNVNDIYINFIGRGSEETNSNILIFDAVNGSVDKKNIFLSYDNYFVDTTLKTDNVSTIVVNLSLKGELTFPDGRLFYKGTDEILYKINEVDPSDLEKMEQIEVDSKPSKDIYKFKYGVIK